MSKKPTAPPLNADQHDRIEATLKRIRAGLALVTFGPFDEPAHTFVPEAYRDDQT